MLKSKIFWIALILLLFVPMIISFAFFDSYVPILQRVLTGWRYQSSNLILSDILFVEAGCFIFFGALLAGAVLYLAWSPGWMGLFVDPVFHWKIVKKEREIPAALILGFLVIAIGIIYLSAAIIVTA